MAIAKLKGLVFSNYAYAFLYLFWIQSIKFPEVSMFFLIAC